MTRVDDTFASLNVKFRECFLRNTLNVCLTILSSLMPKLILSAKSYSRSNYDTLSQYVEFVVNLLETYSLTGMSSLKC